MPLLEPSKAGLTITGKGIVASRSRTFGHVAIDDEPIGRRQARAADQLLGARLVERGGKRQRIGAGVGNVEHFEHRRHAGFARTAAAGSLGEVEDQIGPAAVDQSTQHGHAVAQKLDFMAERFQHRG